MRVLFVCGVGLCGVFCENPTPTPINNIPSPDSAGNMYLEAIYNARRTLALSTNKDTTWMLYTNRDTTESDQICICEKIFKTLSTLVLAYVQPAQLHR